MNPSQPPTSTLVVAGIHKEFQQVTSGLTSLGVTSEVRADPQLSTNSTSEVDPEKSAPMTLYLNNKEKEPTILKRRLNMLRMNSTHLLTSQFDDTKRTIKLERSIKASERVHAEKDDVKSLSEELQKKLKMLQLLILHL
ncbi:hypothetical protein Tco_0012365 [Tanacetum coccineum]